MVNDAGSELVHCAPQYTIWRLADQRIRCSQAAEAHSRMLSPPVSLGVVAHCRFPECPLRPLGDLNCPLHVPTTFAHCALHSRCGGAETAPGRTDVTDQRLWNTLLRARFVGSDSRVSSAMQPVGGYFQTHATVGGTSGAAIGMMALTRRAGKRTAIGLPCGAHTGGLPALY